MKVFVKRWSRRLFAAGARGMTLKRRPELPPGLRILTYHRIEDDPSDPFAVRPSSFASQMEVLAGLGRVIPLSVALPGQGKASDEPRVVITFDDGTEDFLDQAVPVLEGLRLPATLYVSPALVGRRGYLGWRDLEGIRAAGVEVGSHGLDHVSLGALDRASLRRQVVDSRRLLEDQLGCEVRSIAYPFGTVRDFSALVRREVAAAGYQSGCTSVNGLNRSDADPLALCRTKIEAGDDPIFRWVVGGCLDAWAFFDRRLSRLQNRYA